MEEVVGSIPTGSTTTPSTGILRDPRLSTKFRDRRDELRRQLASGVDGPQAAASGTEDGLRGSDVLMVVQLVVFVRDGVIQTAFPF